LLYFHTQENKMELILRQDIAHLGKAGDKVMVKDGYARNYLIPRGLAWVLTEVNLKRLEAERNLRAAKEEKEKKETFELVKKLTNAACTITVETNEQDKLYGSITAQEISHTLEQEGIVLDKKKIILAEPLKELGIYDIPVDLGFDIKTKIKVWVVKK